MAFSMALASLRETFGLRLRSGVNSTLSMARAARLGNNARQGSVESGQE